MTIGDIVKKKKGEVQVIEENAPLVKTVDTLNAKKIGSLLVQNETGEISGILTERDILRVACKAEGDQREIPVSQLMTPRDKLIIGIASDTVSYIMTVMTENRIRHIPVYEDKKLIGIMSIGDVVKAVMDESEAEVDLLREYILNPYGINYG